MKDAIDKRNERERIAKTIVKRRNIVYVSREELERRQQEEREQQMREERKAAEEVVNKLKEDANNKMAMEIQRLIADREMLERQLKTGMDATGKKPMNEVTQERVEAILSEKSKQLQDIIAAHSVESGEKIKAMEPGVQADAGSDGARTENDAAQAGLSIPETGAEEAAQNMGTEHQNFSAGSRVVQEERLEGDEF